MRRAGLAAVVGLVGVLAASGPASADARQLVRFTGQSQIESLAGPVLAAGRVLYGWSARERSLHLEAVDDQGGKPHQLWRKPAPASRAHGTISFIQSFLGLAGSRRGVAFVRSVIKVINPCADVRPRRACERPVEGVPYLEHLQSGPWSGPFAVRDGFDPGQCQGRFVLGLASTGEELLYSDAERRCGAQQRRREARVVLSPRPGGRVRVLARSGVELFHEVAAAGRFVAWVVATRGRKYGRPPGPEPKFIEVLDLRSGHRRRLSLPRCGLAHCTMQVLSLAIDATGRVAALIGRSADTAKCDPLPLLALSAAQATALHASRVRVAGSSLALADGRVFVSLASHQPRTCNPPGAVALVPVSGGRVHIVDRFAPGTLTGQLAWNGRQAAWAAAVHVRPHWVEAIWSWHPRADRR